MIFEDSPFVGLDFPPPPLDARVGEPEQPEPVDSSSVQYSQNGFVVIGAEHAGNGLIMMVSDAQGRTLGVAFGDGDGNWGNEWEAMQSGVACAGGLHFTGVTAGMTSVVTGAMTAAVCFDFIYDLGTLYSEYNGNTHNYTRTEVYNVGFEPRDWDVTYVYTYEEGGSWSITYDRETETYGEWVWKTG